MNFQWAEGFRPPKGISVEAMRERLYALPEPSPQESFEASKDSKDLLYDATWGEGDQVWATRARLDFHRRIIGAVHEVMEIGGREITIRSVEFIRPGDGEGRWSTLEQIRSDPELLRAYIREVRRLQEQAAAKMAKIEELMVPE